MTLSLCSIQALSQKNLATINTENPYPKIFPLNWLNEQFLIKQRNRIEEVVRRNFGQSLKIGEGNIALLQRVVNEAKLDMDDKMTTQALGVVLGDIFTEADKRLIWQVYEDELGKSHAVCVQETKHCVFPVTMISRRMEAGAPANVHNIYKKNLDALKSVLPKRPYFD